MDLLLLIPLLIIFLGIPLLQIRKQNKRLREIREFQSSLQIGDIVRTSSGVHGEVVAVSDLTVVLEIAPSVQVTWDKAAVLEAITPASTSDDVAAEADESAVHSTDDRTDEGGSTPHSKPEA